MTIMKREGLSERENEVQTRTQIPTHIILYLYILNMVKREKDIR